jgi:hypothetical protein
MGDNDKIGEIPRAIQATGGLAERRIFFISA